MSGTMSGMNGTAAGAVAPPPVPGSAYYVALGGQPTGPFDPAVLKQMALSGQFTADTLVWKPGMEQWQKAGELDELKAVAGQLPPVIPN
jgi:hypothetical protein